MNVATLAELGAEVALVRWPGVVDSDDRRPVARPGQREHRRIEMVRGPGLGSVAQYLRPQRSAIVSKEKLEVRRQAGSITSFLIVKAEQVELHRQPLGLIGKLWVEREPVQPGGDGLRLVPQQAVGKAPESPGLGFVAAAPHEGIDSPKRLLASP